MRTISPLECFKDFVPWSLRVVLFLIFAVIFQFANPTYTTLMGDMVGAHQFYAEDISFANTVSTIGAVMVFPVLFRIKFRFTSQQILLTCSLLLLPLLWLSMMAGTMQLLIPCAFFIGAFKMIGSFEALVSLQLIITPKKDYGIFYTVAMGLILLCNQVSGITAVFLSEASTWQAIYIFVIALLCIQVSLILVLMRPYRISKLLPLYGIDWSGSIHWTIFIFSLCYLFGYGQLLDWFSSPKIIISTMILLLWGLLLVYRTLSLKRPFISPKVFKLKNVTVAIIIILLGQIFLNTTGNLLSPITSSVMHLDDLHVSALNWWIALGIVIGALFCFYWFKYANFSFRYLFALAFLAFTLHHALLFFSFSFNSGEKQLYLPYVLKGFGNIILFTAAGKYMTIGVDLKIFTQMLWYMAMFRNTLGNAIIGSLIGRSSYKLSQEYLQKMAAKMDVSTTAPFLKRLSDGYSKAGLDNGQASRMASKALYFKIKNEALLLSAKELFGTMTLVGLAVLLALVFYHHFASPYVKSVPTWQKLWIATRSTIYTNIRRNKKIIE
jgi:DHA2 family multidrug resistance protein